MADTKVRGVTQEMRDCIEISQRCHEICLEMVDHCQRKGGEQASPDHLRLLLDCSHICQATSDFAIRASDFLDQACGVCAAICERCADECEPMAEDELEMRCVEICRACARTCLQIAHA
jgi:hypothetical protein